MEYKLLRNFHEAAQYARKYAIKSGVVTKVKRATSGWLVVPLARESYRCFCDNGSFDPLDELDEICSTLPMRELESELFLSAPDSKERAIVASHINSINDADSDDDDFVDSYREGVHYFRGTLDIVHLGTIGDVYYLDDGRGDSRTHVLTVHPPNKAEFQETLKKLEGLANRTDLALDIRLTCWDWNESYMSGQTRFTVYKYNRLISVEEDCFPYAYGNFSVTPDLIVTLEFEREYEDSVNDLDEFDY